MPCIPHIQKRKGKERKGKERKGKERNGKERKGKGREGKGREGKGRTGKERKGKERKGKERKRRERERERKKEKERKKERRKRRKRREKERKEGRKEGRKKRGKGKEREKEKQYKKDKRSRFTLSSLLLLLAGTVPYLVRLPDSTVTPLGRRKSEVDIQLPQYFRTFRSCFTGIAGGISGIDQQRPTRDGKRGGAHNNQPVDLGREHSCCWGTSQRSHPRFHSSAHKIQNKHAKISVILCTNNELFGNEIQKLSQSLQHQKTVK